MASAIHQHESVIGVYVTPPSFEPPSNSLPTSSFQVITGFRFPTLHIKLTLTISFTYVNLYVSMLFSQIIPPSPSPTMSKSLFFMSVSPSLPSTKDHKYYLSRFHIYVLIYDICLSLSDSLHSV